MGMDPADPTGARPARARPAGAHDLAAATGADRDRYLDFLRVFSIGVVVLGHWLMVVVEPRSDGVRAANALGAMPELQWLTWLLQVMPVFFFVGGFSHATALRSPTRRDDRYADFVRGRSSRLLRPTVPFLVVWLLTGIVLELTGRQTGFTQLAASTVVQPLWFVGVYLAVVALAPPMLRWHDRHGVAVPVVLGVGAVGVDLARFGLDLSELGMLNVALVWLAVHQMGFLYADGTLTRHRRTGAALAAGGLVTVLALTVVAHRYPVSMVGLPGERVSNMNPPTAALLAHAVWLTGLVLLVREPVGRWLRGLRVWTAVVAANGMVMTVFLWHLTALFAAYGLALWWRLPLPAVGTAAWWLTRPVWLAALVVLLAALVALFRRAERPVPRSASKGRTGER